MINIMIIINFSGGRLCDVDA